MKATKSPTDAENSACNSFDPLRICADRKAAEDRAVLLSLIDPNSVNDPWLVVDVGEIDKPKYRVWREQTLTDGVNRFPDYPYIHFELVSSALNGRLTRIS